MPQTGVSCILSHVSHSKYLGMTLSEDLQWNLQVSSVVPRANQTLWIPYSHQRTVWHTSYWYVPSYKMPALSGTLIQWKTLGMLDKVQRRGARFVKNDCRPDSSITEMLTGLQWVPLEERRRNARLRMLDKIVGRRVAINFLRTMHSVLTPGQGQLTKSNWDTF